jgi:hypothetical protein
LKAGVWFRRGRLLIVSPVRGHIRRTQAETPLIDLFSFAEPPLKFLRSPGPRYFKKSAFSNYGSDQIPISHRGVILRRFRQNLNSLIA